MMCTNTHSVSYIFTCLAYDVISKRYASSDVIYHLVKNCVYRTGSILSKFKISQTNEDGKYG